MNACYDELRKRKRRPMLHVCATDDPDSRASPGRPSPTTRTRWRGRWTSPPRSPVPEEFRVALVLADVQDLPYEEIGRILDIPLGTVKSRVHRGRIALARALADAPGEPTGSSRTSEEEP